LQTIYDTLYFDGNLSYFIVGDVVVKSRALDSYDAAKDVVNAAKNSYLGVSSDPTAEKIKATLTETLSTLNSVSNALDKTADALDDVIVHVNLTQTELDTLKTNINTRRTTTDSSYDSIQTARQNLDDAEITYKTQIDSAEQAINAAEKTLLKSQADLALKKAAARPEDISWYQAKVRQAEVDWAYAQQKFQDTIIKAPIAGIISNKNYEVGELVASNATVLTLSTPGEYEVKVDISESDIAKIREGQLVKITLDAYTDNEIFSSRVTKIDPAQTVLQDVVYYKVTVTFESTQAENVAALMATLKPGMTANVTIVTGEKKDVLAVPQRAVKDAAGKKTVRTLIDGQAVEQEVKTGMSADGGLIEITSGLKENDTVITFVKNNT